MRLEWGSLVFALMLLLISPSWAGTGGAEDSTNSKDVDQALRTSVRWILGIKGLKVLQTERTADLNEYRVDQKASSGVMKAITDGLAQRKWKVTGSKQNAKTQVLEAIKDDKKLRVSLAKTGKEPRLTVEIRKYK